ncbi:hypothetical protein PROFUN_08997 [Planoprotostelium fungivorum]|uniref:Uncharacterized protein n=1 Tax=Planoprotostelium fungivorum TaxID=1890364 RepID=A0A2P6NIP0_9EUKA|nr:hypothetical protein PROFUN_08997 [Planoprotostelium fungivorum]
MKCPIIDINAEAVRIVLHSKGVFGSVSITSSDISNNWGDNYIEVLKTSDPLVTYNRYWEAVFMLRRFLVAIAYVFITDRQLSAAVMLILIFVGNNDMIHMFHLVLIYTPIAFSTILVIHKAWKKSKKRVEQGKKRCC